jgi:hypothetical protein
MNLKRFFFAALALFVAVAFFQATPVMAQGQANGSIVGTVTDPSGAVVPGAQVALKDNAKGNSQSTKTNAGGVYQFFLLSPSNYTVTITATGFAVASRSVDVGLGQPTEINVPLSVSGGGTTVTVTESAPLIQSENGDVTSTLSQQQVSQVPNPGNDLSYVAQIAPGVVMNTQGGFGNFEVFGLPGTSNLFTINGMDDNDPFLNLNNSGATNLLLGQNEVQEASVVTNGYSGTFGGLAGANVNYITKSGGNDYHGNAIYYWNGRAMNANDWINNATGTNRPFDNVNQWAGGGGGPIIKDKLFFFVNTEGLRVILPTSALAVVPTPLYETSTINQLNANGLSASVPFYQNMFNIYNGASGIGGAKPGNGNPGDPLGCSGFTDAPSGLGITQPCTQSFQSTAGNFTHEWQLAGRGDWNIGPNDKAFLRVQYDTGVQATFTDVINPLFNDVSTQPEYQGQLVETHTFGPTFVNQIIMSGSWYTALFGPANLGATLALYPTNMLFLDGSMAALGGIGFDFPQGRNVTQYGVQDDMSKTWNNHTIKWGVKFRRNDISDHDYGVRSSGEVLTDISSLFNGISDELIQTFPTSLSNPIAIYSFQSYLQDDWRIKSNLTFTVALRGEHFSNPICQRLCFARMQGPFNAVTHDVNQPYNQAILTNQKQALQGLDSVVWEPRVSFAWSPFGSSTGFWKSNFVVRGGAGIFADQFPGQIADNMSFNPPFLSTFRIFGANLSPTETNGPNGGNEFSAAAQFNQAFSTGFVTGETLGQIQAAIPGFRPPNITTVEAKNRNPQYQKWSLEVQKGFGNNTSLSVSYVGDHGVHELIDNNSVNSANFFAGSSTRVDPRFRTVSALESAAISNYNGLVVSFQHRFTRFGSGVFQANYTWSHAFDIISNGGFESFSAQPITPQDPNNLRGMYGPADYDVRHSFNANYVWEVPVRTMLRGHGSDYFVKGWQVSGAIFARSALPYSVIDGATSAGLNSVGYVGPLEPQFLGGTVPSCGKNAVFANSNLVPCLTAAQFVAPGNETGFVTGQRNVFRGPKYFDTDFTIMKYTKIPGWERASLGIGLQFFNLFNHPNFTLPNADISSGNFGQILGTVSTPTSILGSFLGGDASPRLIQLKAEFKF